MEELDSFRYPRRRPWLLLGILAVVAVVLVVRYRRPAVKPAPPAAAERAAPRAPTASRRAAAEAPPAPLLPPAAPDQASLQKRMAEARALEEQGRLLEARTAYLALRKQALAGPTQAEAEERLGRIHVQLVTTPRMMPEKIEYVVEKGDSVERIAKRFGTTAKLIEISNELARPDRIRAGDRLRVLSAKFALAVSKSRHDMVVYLNQEFFKRYGIGTGKFGKTPPGTFVISDKLVDPVWWHPDGRELPPGHPENILGSRWLALKATGDTPPVRGYGIHGTTDEATIGQAESAGCIRMRNGEVAELFDLIPLETPVVVME